MKNNVLYNISNCLVSVSLSVVGVAILNSKPLKQSCGALNVFFKFKNYFYF